MSSKLGYRSIEHGMYFGYPWFSISSHLNGVQYHWLQHGNNVDITNGLL